jgi:hypothetical protein
LKLRTSLPDLESSRGTYLSSARPWAIMLARKLLCQVEEQDLRIPFSFNCALIGNRSIVAVIKILAVQVHCTSRNPQPGTATARELCMSGLHPASLMARKERKPYEARVLHQSRDKVWHVLSWPQSPPSRSRLHRSEILLKFLVWGSP